MPYHCSRFSSGSGSGRPPLPPMVAAPAGAKVVASDFYRGKVKSIYEREPLFRDFAEVQQLWVDLDRGQNFLCDWVFQ
jgi:hypothetical protein